MAGILRPTSGRVVVAGTDITLLDEAGLVRHRRSTVGVVFQAFNLVPSLSASENVQSALRTAGVSPRRAKARALAAARPGRSCGPGRHEAGPALRRPAAASGHRQGAGPRSAPDPGRRAHRPPRLRPVRDRADAPAGAGRRWSDRRDRDARRPPPPARRSGGRAHAPVRRRRLQPPRHPGAHPRRPAVPPRRRQRRRLPRRSRRHRGRPTSWRTAPASTWPPSAPDATSASSARCSASSAPPRLGRWAMPPCGSAAPRSSDPPWGPGRPPSASRRRRPEVRPVRSGGGTVPCGPHPVPPGDAGRRPIPLSHQPCGRREW